jgi:hypothetical protein
MPRMSPPLPPGYLTPHFSLAEFTASEAAARRGIDNTPPFHLLRNLERTAQMLERVRQAIGDVPILILSGYRSSGLNAAVRGSRNSAHMRGLAADFHAPRFGSPRDLCVRLSGMVDALGIDQLIWEGTWAHIGLFETEPPRGQIMTAHFRVGAAPYYTPGIA